MILISPEISRHYPQSRIGVMKIHQADNPEYSLPLESAKRLLEDWLRVYYAHPFSRKDLPTVAAYLQYYKPFGKQYHVLMQLDSIVDKLRPIPSRATLVEAMFMAELKSQLLTAGHDIAALQGQLKAELSSGFEKYELLGGKAQQVKAGDIVMRDEQEIIGSILYGPDQRTKITPQTKDILFVVYAPFAIADQQIYDHFQCIVDYVRLFSPQCAVGEIQIYSS